MEINIRKATQRQLAYIQQLRSKQGKDSLEIDEELSSQEASEMIKALMEGSQTNEEIRPLKINEARLGMAMKECFLFRRGTKTDNFGQHRDFFKKEAIKTYQLFTEIA